jgi:heme exporter protein CcmD
VNDPHTGFIVAAYATAVVVIGGMIAATILDHRALRKALARVGALIGRAADQRDDG